MKHSKMMFKTTGVTLIELLIVAAIVGIVAIGVSRFYTSSVQRNLEIEYRSRAQSELDAMATQLRKDFERHSNAANAIEQLPINPPFNAVCKNLTIRQKVLGVAPAPDTVRKIEYKTLCNGAAFPNTNTRTDIHSELLASCATAPKITRTYWANEATGGVGVPTVHPTEPVKSLAVCFKPNLAVNPTQYTAELSVAYPVNDKIWKVLRKTLTLVVNEFGAGVEVLPPQ